MGEKNSGSAKKSYRVGQLEGKISWTIEELWDGGVTRGPFGTKNMAVQHEEKIAKEEGFIDDLVLEEVVSQEAPLADCVALDADGNWLCHTAIAVEDKGRKILLPAGMTFHRGTPFNGVDVGEWLDKNVSSS